MIVFKKSFEENGITSVRDAQGTALIPDSVWDECEGELDSLFKTGEEIRAEGMIGYWSARHGYIPGQWWTKADKDGDPPICVAKDIERISPVLRGLIEHRLFESCGVIASKYVPLPLNYFNIPEDVQVYLRGSWLYELNEPGGSDFDMVVVGKGGFRKDNLQSDVTFLPEDVLSHRAANGNRHAWEVLVAPSDCCIQQNEAQSERLQKMRKFLEGMPQHPQFFEQGTIQYFNEFSPFLKCKVAHCTDSSIRSWIAQKGWAYKLGYYIMVDAMLSREAQGCGSYDVRHVFKDERIRRFVLQCKRGEMTYEYFKDIVHPWLPEEGVSWDHDRSNHKVHA